MKIETGPEVNKQRKFVRQKRYFRRRNTGHKIQPVRRMIQLSFFLIILWIGFEFARFVHQLEQGIVPTVSRPPGVEGFLPISALISLKYWSLTGVFNTIHPSALVLLLIILVTAIFLKKGFCSWVCPVGFISELLTKLHKMVFDRQFKLATWLDYPLRTLKYLLMLFFLFAVFVQMRLVDLHHFIYSPYNKIADIKMLRFFTEMSSVTFWTLLILVAFSFAIPYFWCRYLCPYGALLGGLSFLSPFKIHRVKENCIDCEKCSKICPAKIKVHQVKQVWSDECHACLSCVDVCPVKDTLHFSAKEKQFKLPGKIYAFLIVFVFILGIAIARLGGFWQNEISIKEYQYHIRHLNDPAYQHNRGQVPEYDENSWK